MSGLLNLISLSFYAHYSASIHFLPNLFGAYHLFVILNIQCKFCWILWEFIFYIYQNSSLSLVLNMFVLYVYVSK